MSFTSLDIDNIKYFVQNATVHISIHHDEAKFFFDEIKSLNTNFIVINIDRHSDIHLNIAKQSITPANWVNFVLLENNIDAFYWIYPKDLLFHKDVTSSLEMGPLYLNKTSLLHKNIFKKVFLDKTNIEVISENKISTLYNNCKNFNINYFYQDVSLQEFKLNILPLNTFSLPKNKTIYLSIDADYFSSNSMYSFYSFINYKFIKNRISSFLKSIKEKGIQPEYISLAYSPSYILSSHEQIISDFFNLLKKYSKNN